MKKLLAGATAGMMLAATAWVGGTGVALADYRSDRDALCGSGDANNCSIDIRDEPFSLVEGVDKATVHVSGTANVASRLQMYTVEPSQFVGVWYRMRAYGSPVAFTTNASGRASVMVPIAVLQAPQNAGSSVGFQLVGATLEDIQNKPISSAPGAGFPDLTYVRSARGADSTYSQSVNDGLLHMRVAGGLTGDVYGVQIETRGAWRDITNLGVAGNGKVDRDGYANIYADVSGFADGEYRVRVFNRTRGLYDLTDPSIDQGLVTLEKNIYITPGEHLKNGRKWRTVCEAYSQTSRCRTEIWATTVENKGGKIVKRTGWAFNNLTYKESARSLWKNNPLGNAGSYTIDGRRWRTECDTPATGGNGCRSFIRTTVVESIRSGRGYTYKLVTKEVFNNIVLFKS